MKVWWHSSKSKHGIISLWAHQLQSKALGLSTMPDAWGQTLNTKYWTNILFLYNCKNCPHAPTVLECVDTVLLSAESEFILLLFIHCNFCNY